MDILTSMRAVGSNLLNCIHPRSHPGTASRVSTLHLVHSKSSSSRRLFCSCQSNKERSEAHTQIRTRGDRFLRSSGQIKPSKETRNRCPLICPIHQRTKAPPSCCANPKEAIEPHPNLIKSFLAFPNLLCKPNPNEITTEDNLL